MIVSENFLFGAVNLVANSFNTSERSVNRDKLLFYVKGQDADR